MFLALDRRFNTEALLDVEYPPERDVDLFPNFNGLGSQSGGPRLVPTRIALPSDDGSRYLVPGEDYSTEEAVCWSVRSII